MESKDKNLKKILIRDATISDLNDIAQVKILTWKTTYPGMISQLYLDSLTIENTVPKWENFLKTCNQKQSRGFLLVAAIDNKIENDSSREKIVGFIAGGPERSLHEFFESEIYALYVLDGYQHLHIGTELFKKAVRRFIDQGSFSMLLWSHILNPAVEFYKNKGGFPLKKRIEQIGGEGIDEISFGWTDLRKIKIK
jgi:ribosomal protein S18 acetylase RimI-like enzyme